MSILMNDSDKSKPPDGDLDEHLIKQQGSDDYRSFVGRRPEGMEIALRKDMSVLRPSMEDQNQLANVNVDSQVNAAAKTAQDDVPFDEEPNQELLRQYIALDYEISQLEDKDALRVYHEKIEQLEQLEHELDMISSEAEEVAARSETGTRSELAGGSAATAEGKPTGDSKMMDNETTSLISGVTDSMSRKSWTPSNNNNNNNNGTAATSAITTTTNNNKTGGASQTGGGRGTPGSTNSKHKTQTTMTLAGKKNGSTIGSQMIGSNRHYNNLSYSTVEEVFNRKIILEKERDRLKKEVEANIVECDKLQQRYKKRDAILDKLFDGRTGNGLENHLEQQLNWLMEQKQYVDQIFYSWKRAETLTTQTCEQFEEALELLKRFQDVEDPSERSELVKNISHLLTKSRQDLEKAQKYNPNVDAPFFTENETKRFNAIIESISSASMSPTEFSQALTVVQFAWKRAGSIRMWLEQILSTTIARDSFELAEEYKWIAIQLRKERINLIKAKLQEPVYAPMIRSIQEQMVRLQSSKGDAARRQREINRDSGIESETNDIDVEEEIYRLLEQHKSRLLANPHPTPTSGDNNNNNNAAAAAANGKQSQGQQQATDQKLKVQVVANQSYKGHSNQPSSSDSNNNDQKMRERVQKRVNGERPLHSAKLTNRRHHGHHGQVNQQKQQKPPMPDQSGSASTSASNNTIEIQSNDGGSSIARLKIELDEEAKQSLLKEVDQDHLKHKNKIEKLKGSNRAKVADMLMNRMQQVRDSQQHSVSSERLEPAS